MVNFEGIFGRVLHSVFNDGDTIRQALIHIPLDIFEQNSQFKYQAMESRILGMINECSNMSNIRTNFFNFNQSS